MAESYKLTTIADLLDVPTGLRERCLRELDYALALQELAFGDKAKESLALPITWTNDNDKSATLYAVDGTEILKLKVTDGNNG